MTIEEVEDVVRALSAVAEKLEAGAAQQSIQEAFIQARAYAGERGTSDGKIVPATTGSSMISSDQTTTMS
jgi:hypothetical protein